MDPFADLPLTLPGADREGHRRTDPGRLDEALTDLATRVLDVTAGRVQTRDGELRLRPATASDADRLVLHLGRLDGGAVLAVVHDPPSPEQATGDEDDLDAAAWTDLRGAADGLPAAQASLAATAVALANWHAAHPRCPRCGEPAEPAAAGWVRRCPADGSEHHPRTDPAVIVAVTDPDDRLLLARNQGWPEGRFAIIAGFVEPGETLAAAVAREVGEEVGLQVEDVRYAADQPWPFPASLMIGFSARATGTEITLLDGEIAEAGWYTRQEYLEAVRSGRVRRAGRLSISARLVEQWLGRRLDDLDDRG
nr:NAD(+) diphosphatase [Janibacter alkaliphilus]